MSFDGVDYFTRVAFTMAAGRESNVK